MHQPTRFDWHAACGFTGNVVRESLGFTNFLTVNTFHFPPSILEQNYETLFNDDVGRRNHGIRWL
jgi:hypothetical protein